MSNKNDIIAEEDNMMMENIEIIEEQSSIDVENQKIKNSYKFYSNIHSQSSNLSGYHIPNENEHDPNPTQTKNDKIMRNNLKKFSYPTQNSILTGNN